MRFTLVTLGCKLNWAEGSALARRLVDAGWEQVEAEAAPDVCVVNTCAVTGEATRKSRQAVGRCHRLSPGARVVVMGCSAELARGELLALPGVWLVAGRDDKHRVADMILDAVPVESPDGSPVSAPGAGGGWREGATRAGRKEGATTETAPAFHGCHSSTGRTRSFVKVQDGCDNRCAYCCVSAARGPSRSATVREAVALCNAAAADGARELVLTGVNLAHFGRSRGESLAGLLRALDADLDERVRRVRVSSVEPDLVDDELLDAWAESRRVMPHFHIPLQSGSDELLRLLGRRYDTALYARLVRRIRERLPEAFIGADVIVGCRGETAERFGETLRFVEALAVSQLHVFTYSERPGTRALELRPVVDPRERRRRHDQLQQVSERKREAFYAANVGRVTQVLVEGGGRGGWTPNYVRAALAAPAEENSLVTVRLGRPTTDGAALEAAPAE